jgi:hypothetical protein
MSEKLRWKIWLKHNLLTQDLENDYIAEVSTAGDTLHNGDIAARIVAGRTELRLETIKSILAERDVIVQQALMRGTAVQDGCVRLAPKVAGAWAGISHTFDPEVHKITLSATPSAEMRAALEDVGVEVLGEKNSGAYIGLVTDVASDRKDGTITPDEDLIVSGDKIKIAPAGEAGLGVFFTDESGVDHPVTRKLLENSPKKLIFRVPSLAPGMYTLKVVTRFSNSKFELKEPRVITCEFPLTVQSPAP